jgi:hypothetical protein
MRIEGVAWSAQRIPPVVSLGFLDRSRYYFFQVASQLSSRGWVDPVPHPLLLRKSGSAGNRTQDFSICTQKLWPLDHRGGRIHIHMYLFIYIYVICISIFSLLSYFEKIEQAYEITLLSLCVCVCMCILSIVPRQRLDESPLIVARQHLRCYAVRVVSKKIRRLVFPELLVHCCHLIMICLEETMDLSRDRLILELE